MNTSAVETLDKLQGLVRLYGQGFSSDVIDRAIDKLLSTEVAQARNELCELEARLAAYEAQYEISSDAFYQRFRAGELGDDIDFVEWSVFYDMRQSILERLRMLGEPTPGLRRPTTSCNSGPI